MSAGGSTSVFTCGTVSGKMLKILAAKGVTKRRVRERPACDGHLSVRVHDRQARRVSSLLEVMKYKDGALSRGSVYVESWLLAEEPELGSRQIDVDISCDQPHAASRTPRAAYGDARRLANGPST